MLAFVVMAGTFSLNAQQNQRLAYVDSDYILQNIPEYSDAQEEINNMSLEWEREIQAIRAEVEEMYKEYQTESVLLSEDQKRRGYSG